MSTLSNGNRMVSLVVAAAMSTAPTVVLAQPADDSAEQSAPAEETAPATEEAAPEGSETPGEGGGEGDPAVVDDGSEGASTEGLVLDQEAADRQNAKAAYLEGSDYYETGQYAKAVEQFTRAWELSKKELLLYNIGQAYWKWYDIDPNIDHLRQAALFFRNFQKRMRLTEDYDPTEVDNILKAIEAQIQVHEQKETEANRPVIVQPGGPTEEELAWEQRQRTTKGLVISGTTISVLGGLTLAAGVAAVLSRTTFKVLLDSSTSSDGGINLASAEEDASRRNGYSVSGEVAFGTLIAAAAILPIGIGLRVAGAVREKKDRQKARERDEIREQNEAKAKKVAIEPTLGGLRVRF